MVLRAFLIKDNICSCVASNFLIGNNFLLSVNCGIHSDYQSFIIENLRIYYPNSDAISHYT